MQWKTFQIKKSCKKIPHLFPNIETFITFGNEMNEMINELNDVLAA